MTVLFFIIGLFLGSFLNSFIWRYRQNILETIINERSMCPQCGHVLQADDLLPLISYLILGGRCRYCKKPISMQYPMVEMFFGLLTMLLYWQFGLSVTLFVFIVIGFILTALMVIDILDGLLPNGLIIMLVIMVFFGLILTQASGQIWINAILGGLIGFGFYMSLWLITLGKGVGVGDIKLGFALGLLIGLPAVTYITVLAFVMGGLYVLPLLVIGAKGMKSKIAFGPFMILAYFLVLFMGERLSEYVNLINF